MNKKVLGIVLGCIALAAGVVFILVGVGQMSQKAPAKNSLSKTEIEKTLKASQEAMLTYTHKASGASVQYPKSWQVQETPNGGVAFQTLSGVVNVRFVSDDFTSKKAPVTLKDYSDLLMKQGVEEAKKQNVVIAPVSDSDTTLAGTPGHQWTYSVSIGEVHGLGMQAWTVKNNRSYVLTYTASKDLYDQFLPVFKKMVETLTVTQ